MIVTACSGSLFASPALAALLDLDRRQALQCMVLSTLVMPLSLFVFLSVFHGGKVQIDLQVYALRILIYLLLPFVDLRGLSDRCPPALVACDAAQSRRVAQWGVVVRAAGVRHRHDGCASPSSSETHPQQVLFLFLLAATSAQDAARSRRSSCTASALPAPSRGDRRRLPQCRPRLSHWSARWSATELEVYVGVSHAADVHCAGIRCRLTLRPKASVA